MSKYAIIYTPSHREEFDDYEEAVEEKKILMQHLLKVSDNNRLENAEQMFIDSLSEFFVVRD